MKMFSELVTNPADNQLNENIKAETISWGISNFNIISNRLQTIAFHQRECAILLVSNYINARKVSSYAWGKTTKLVNIDLFSYWQLPL